MESTGTSFRNSRCVVCKCHGGGLLSLDAHFPGKLNKFKGANNYENFAVLGQGLC